MRGVTELQSGSGLDINIALRRDGDALTTVSRVELRYFSGTMQASMSFDRIHPRYAGVTQKMLEDAIRHLFSELKFRIKNGKRFFVWYNDPVDRALVESLAASVADRDAVLTRVVDTLVSAGMVKGEDNVKH